MAISDEIKRLSDAADKIKAKDVALGLKLDNGKAVTATQTLEYHAEAIENIQTFSPSTVTLESSEQTISCGEKYVTGDITIPAANVYYTGDSTPESSVGNDGDLFLVV